MFRRPRHSLLAAVAVAAGLIGAPQVLSGSVRADSVSDAQQNLERTQAELDNLINQMGQLDEDYGAAQDKKAQLDEEIAASQVKVDQMSAQLGQLESVLADIAVDKFTSGGNAALSPLFSDAATYSAAQQKDALGNVALDTGEASADDMQQLVDDLSKEKKSLERKQQKVAELITTLEQTQQQYESLQVVYQQKLSDAEARFGAAKLEAEAERQAAAAAARAAAQAAQQQQNNNNNGGTNGASSPGRGGGGNNGGTNGGGNDSGGSGSGSGGSTSTPKPTAPPVSGKAGVAVSAAYSQLGVPYRFAAESPGVAFDCSGLTKWAWGRAGVYLPHQSAAQYGSVAHISRDQIQPGDLIFYYSPIGHVAIYVGNGMLIHAPATGKTVELAPVRWAKVVGVGRPG